MAVNKKATNGNDTLLGDAGSDTFSGVIAHGGGPQGLRAGSGYESRYG